MNESEAKSGPTSSPAAATVTSTSAEERQWAMDTGLHAEESEYTGILEHINALKTFLANNADKIAQASKLKVLTPGQSLLLRAAVAAERALEAFANSRQPF